MSKEQTFVIASLAGAKAAERLRPEGLDGRVVLVGEEPERPYERPPLSKDYLRGDAGRDSLTPTISGVFVPFATNEDGRDAQAIVWGFRTRAQSRAGTGGAGMGRDDGGPGARRPTRGRRTQRARQCPGTLGDWRVGTEEALKTMSMSITVASSAADPSCAPVSEQAASPHYATAMPTAPPSLRVVQGEPAFDLGAAERAVRDLLSALGQDPSSEHLRDTPRRVATSYAELLTPREFSLTTFPNDEGYDELVVARDLPLHSLCQHHLLPFSGVAHVGYLPGERILGLSKLARVVEMFARRLQVQERLTKQVADWLQHHLQPKGVGVVIEAEHLCMSLRGVQAPGCRTVTSAVHGLLREDPRSRSEFFALSRVSS